MADLLHEHPCTFFIFLSTSLDRFHAVSYLRSLKFHLTLESIIYFYPCVSDGSLGEKNEKKPTIYSPIPHMHWNIDCPQRQMAASTAVSEQHLFRLIHHPRRLEGKLSKQCLPKPPQKIEKEKIWDSRSEYLIYSSTFAMVIKQGGERWRDIFAPASFTNCSLLSASGVRIEVKSANVYQRRFMSPV